MDVDVGQLDYPSLKDCPVVVELDEVSPVGRRTTGRRDWRRLERFAEVREGLTSRGLWHPGLLPLANLRFEVSRLLPAVYFQPDIATTSRARKPTRAMSFAQAIREVSCERGFAVVSQQTPVP